MTSYLCQPAIGLITVSGWNEDMNRRLQEESARFAPVAI